MARRITITHFPKRLDIGCGETVIKDYVGMDTNDYGQAIVWNVENGIPLPNETVENIRTSHTLEHIHPDKMVKVLNECWRVLIPNGELYVIVPSEKNDRYRVVTHLTFFNETTFKTLTETRGDCYAYIKPWIMKELVTNERGDIHCKLIKSAI